jgi:hypothetical protein
MVYSIVMAAWLFLKMAYITYILTSPLRRTLDTDPRRIGDRLVWVVRSNDLSHWATRAPYCFRRGPIVFCLLWLPVPPEFKTLLYWLHVVFIYQVYLNDKIKIYWNCVITYHDFQVSRAVVWKIVTHAKHFQSSLSTWILMFKKYEVFW